jgi:hypothetical protein
VDRWTGGQVDRWTSGQVDSWMLGIVMKIQADEQVDRQVNTLTDGKKDRWEDRQDKWTGGWADTQRGRHMNR